MQFERELKPKGIVIIPKDVRENLNLQEKDKILITVKDNKLIIEKKKQDGKEWLKHFLRYRLKGKSPTREELDKIFEESYDLP
ncbi:MAG TPA: AbrB/MazE/SpoVT family DNA-binding domain-containing protein [Candidatus Nanoarchaeia archaeon]|nr:AbrB/MazE/SpoVT family DNA-binding domain-containing protein [Candidatus Nanoarchaeia archaeon]